MRLDLFLSQKTGRSRHQIQKMIAEEGVVIDGRRIFKPSFSIKGAEPLEYNFPARQTEIRLKPENIELEILYEDEAIAVVNKPVGLVVHPGAGCREHTLVNALLNRYKNLPVGSDPLKPGIVHRLDKETSGCLVVAKTEEALKELQRQFKNREVEKIYLALVVGAPPLEGRFDKPLGRHPKSRLKISSRTRKGKEALTTYRVLKRLEDLSLVEVRLHTGRTHQIRVHFSEAGFPIAGDPTYGRRSKLYREKFGRVMLHAWKLRLQHPVNKEEVQFEAPLPEEMESLC